MSSTRTRRSAPYRTRRSRPVSSPSFDESVVVLSPENTQEEPTRRTRQSRGRAGLPAPRGQRSRRATRGRRESAPDLSEASRDETSSTESESLQGHEGNDEPELPSLLPVRPAPRPPLHPNNVVVDLTCDQEEDILILDERNQDLPVVVGESVAPRPRRRMPPMLDIHLDVDLPRSRNQSTVNVTIDLDRSEFFVSPDTPPRQNAPPSYDDRRASEVTVECGICFDSLGQMKAAEKKIMSTFCGHLFCSPCLTTAMRTAMICPQCRKKLTNQKIHQIFI